MPGVRPHPLRTLIFLPALLLFLIGSSVARSAPAADNPTGCAFFMAQLNEAFPIWEPAEAGRCTLREERAVNGVSIRFFAANEASGDAIDTYADDLSSTILEIVAASTAYLPQGYEPSRHVELFFSSTRSTPDLDLEAKARLKTEDDKVCRIVLYRSASADGRPQVYDSFAPMKNIIAHEYFHCLMNSLFREYSQAAGSGWWEEGMADAFSLALFPSAALTESRGARFENASTAGDEDPTTGEDMVEQSYSNEPFIAWALANASWVSGEPEEDRIAAFLSAAAPTKPNASAGDDLSLQRVALSNVMTRADAAAFMTAYAEGALTTLTGAGYGGPPEPDPGGKITVGATSQAPVTIVMPSFYAVHRTLALDMSPDSKGLVSVSARDPAHSPALIWRVVGEAVWRSANEASPPIPMDCGQHVDLIIAGMSTEVATQGVELQFTPGELVPCDKDPLGGAPGTSGASGAGGETAPPSDGGSKPPPAPPAPPPAPPGPPPGPPPPPAPPPGPGGGSTGGQGGQKPPAGGGGQAPPPGGGASQGDWGGEIPIDERRLGWRPPTGGWLGDGYGRRPGGRGNGDPHYVTGDGVFYSTQHVGEFWALTGAEDMAIQVRQSAWKESDSIASISAVALKVGVARVSVAALPQPAIRLDGIPVAAAAPFQRIDLAGGARLEISREGAAIRTVLAVWPDGSTLLMDVLDGWIDLDLQLAAARETHGHRGLLGVPDDDPANDLRPRSGAALSPNESAQVVTFVNAWRIRPEESLFDYPAGRTAASYQDPGFPREPAAPTASALTGARNTCTSRGVADPMLLTACAFDLAMTGETGLLESHRDRQRSLNRIRRVFDRELDPDIGGAEPLASNTMIEMQLRPGQSRTFAVDVSAPQKLHAYPADVSCVDDDDGETAAYQWFDARGRPLSKAKRTCGDVVSEEEVAPGRYYLVVRGPRAAPAVPVAFQAYLVE